MKHPEDALAISVADFLEVAAPDLLWWHVANENATRARINKQGKRYNPNGNKRKRMGVRPGVADLQFILADGKAAFIELKVEGSYQSNTQKAFQADVEARGCAYVVCRSLDDVRVTLEDWGVPLRVSQHSNIDGRAA